MAALFRCKAFCTWTLLFVALMSTLPAAPQGQSSDRPATAWLQDLGDSKAGVRQAAHAWLVRHLGPDHWIAVVDAAGGSNFATRRGLARVLADHPRHFPLAARLTALEDSTMAEVGDWALQESALAWNPKLAETALSVADFPEAWLVEGGRMDLLEVNPKGPQPGGLVVALDRLHRFGAAPVPLVLDPRLDPRRRVIPSVKDGLPPLDGSWAKLLVSLVREHKVTLEVVGWRPDPIGRQVGEGVAAPGAFIRVKARENMGRGRGAQLLARWVRGAAQESDAHRRTACANALAQVGWPAALTWLGQQWLQGDADYFEAVCLGAASGHLPPALLSPQGVMQLLSQGDSGPAGGRPRAWDRTFLAACALRELPGALSDGSALGDVLLRDWPKENPWGQWLRYSAFSGRFRAHSGFAAQALDGIRVQKDPTLRRAALAALVSAGGSDVGELQHIAGMLRGLDSSAVEAWVRDLELLGARPATEADFQALGGDETHVGRFAFWWFLVGAEAQAEAAALALVESEGGLESLALSLREPLAHGRRAEVLAWIQSLHRIAPRQKQRLALRLSLIEAPAALLHLEQTLAQSKSSAHDLMDLAYLVPMEPLGSRAQGALIEALEQQPVPDGLAAALEQAQFNLRGTGAFLQAEEFEANLRRRAVRLSHPLTERILEDSWARRSLGIAGSPLRVPLGSLETRPPR